MFVLEIAAGILLAYIALLAIVGISIGMENRTAERYERKWREQEREAQARKARSL